jgi:transcription elongation factor SPT5
MHVPREDQDALLKFREGSGRISERSWVRIRRGKYKKDLAFVLKVFADTDVVRIAVVPRISMSKKRKSGKAIPALFNPTVVEAVHGEGKVTRSGDKCVFRGQNYRCGFWICTVFSLHSLAEESCPSFDELLFFRSAGLDDIQDDIDKAISSECIKNVWQLGDRLEITGGSFRGMSGQLKAMSAESWTAMVNLDPISTSGIVREFDECEVSLDDLKRYFRVGDNVKAVTGEHKGLCGIVVSFTKGIVTFIAEKTSKEASR